jgi:hypothetical protein
MFDGNLVLVAAAGGGATFFDFSFYFPALVENYRPFSSNCPGNYWRVGSTHHFGA